MVEALRDAIKGHQLAYEAGIIHRDISEGNVMIAENAPYRGFIGDFDCSFVWKQWLKEHGMEATRKNWEQYVHQVYTLVNGEGTRVDRVDGPLSAQWGAEHMLRTRTGTLPFMAIEILEGNAVHEARHDLESFFWLLVWVVLRHTIHDHPKGQRGATAFFQPPSESQCPTQKRGWLAGWEPINVKDNEPLSYLLKELKVLCYRNCRMRGLPIIPLTYEAVLAKFDEALGLKGWPDDDAAIPEGWREPPLALIPSSKEEPSELGIQPDEGRSQVLSRCGKTLDNIPPVMREGPLSGADSPLNGRIKHARCEPAHHEASCKAVVSHHDVNTASRSSSKRSRVDDCNESISKRARRMNHQEQDSVHSVSNT